jgi:DNA-directed RNA polymerase subunit RPC12/RpoP
MAFSSFSKAVEIDKKNNSHREDHIINYIKAALKTENLKSAQNGIDLLKENFTENKEIKNFEKELNSLTSNTEEFKCPECGHIPKISQKFCTKCGTKFKEEDLQEDNYYENITTYLKAKNETLFLFVKEHIDISKKGETYPEKVLIKSIEKFIDKLKTDKNLFKDIFDDKGNKKNNNEDLNNMMFLTLYPKFFISDDIETLAKVLNETESDKFDGYDDIEQYYSYYVYIRDFMLDESKKYMK